MLEIIALFLLGRSIGKQASRKGLKPSTWQIYLVAGWILAEIIGIFVAIAVFGMSDLITIALIGIAFAFSSYFFLRARLDKFPDDWDDEIDHIGNNS